MSDRDVSNGAAAEVDAQRWPRFASSAAVSIWQSLSAVPVADTHEHLKPPSFLALPMGPGRLLRLSYLTRNLRISDGSPNGTGPALEVDLDGASWATVAPYVERIRDASYYRWLMRGLMDLYGLERPILDASTWDRLSEELPARYGSTGWMSRGLDRMGIAGAIWDPFWATGEWRSEDPRLIPSLRVDSWLVAYHPSTSDHDGHNVIRDWAERLDIDVSRLSDLEALIDALVMHNVEAGARSFKFAWAYDRPLSVGATERATAERIFGRRPDVVEQADRVAFGDYLVALALERARDLGLVVQVHTGMGRLLGSDPLLLDPLLSAHPHVVFDLFHGGYPWTRVSAALAHQHPNVRLNLTWLPQLSSAATVEVIKEWIQVVPQTRRISWGGDCTTLEETYGALLGFRWATSVALGELVEEGYFDVEDAIRTAADLQWEAGRDIYRLSAPASAGASDGGSTDPDATVLA